MYIYLFIIYEFKENNVILYYFVMFLICDSACTAGAVRGAGQHGRLGFSYQHERLRSSSKVRTGPARFVPGVVINITKRLAPLLVHTYLTFKCWRFEEENHKVESDDECI
jgi:hypothetical protein